jgi:general stress protein YciG
MENYEYTLYSYKNKDHIYKHKLMLKCHWETGICYLCVTSKKDWKKYRGSGHRWLRLIKKHKSKIHTTLLFTSDDVEVFNNACFYYSELFDVVNNEDFANLIVETGYKERPFVKPIDEETRSSIGRKGGNTAKERKLGIFADENQKYRSEWSKIGASALHEKGTTGGVCSEQWRKENPDLAREFCSAAGKIGGKKHKDMFWWNNGVINKKSYECPGEGWIRGMLMSEKKRKQVYTMLAGHNRKDSSQ